ncbi:hypothetical protein [uncultured Phenylobacterium sp.]|uniref:hypothetical protein n=1 Tax=uncultured Phenylobacterium sp. TaxID=349273 RepID=UPI0025E9B03B|nr:hypothetical protein [uncultured Phenylobacterium sp.]
MGLTHSDTPARQTAFAVAQQARANAQAARAAADRMRTTGGPGTVQPAVKVVESPAQIRDKVMAERGVDRLDLMRLSAQARLEAEISIQAETAERARRANIRTAGVFIDLKV